MPATVHGTDINVFQHCYNHLRAMAPISIASLKGWMQWQLEGVDAHNINRIYHEFARCLTERRLATITEGYIELQ